MFWVAGRLRQHRWQGFMLSMLSINRGNWLDSVEIVEAGEKIDSSERQQFLRLSVCRRKDAGDVAQLVRALPSQKISVISMT
jgi:hypothetical protein